MSLIFSFLQFAWTKIHFNIICIHWSWLTCLSILFIFQSFLSICFFVPLHIFVDINQVICVVCFPQSVDLADCISMVALSPFLCPLCSLICRCRSLIRFRFRLDFVLYFPEGYVMHSCFCFCDHYLVTLRCQDLQRVNFILFILSLLAGNTSMKR